jgi:hypothetical protein
MLYHGPVGLPKDVVPGPAVMRCELAPTSRIRATPTDIPVRIE